MGHVKELTNHEAFARYGEMDYGKLLDAIHSAERTKFNGKSHRVAECLGITPAAYSSQKSRIRNGQVTLGKLKALEKALGISLVTLNG